MKVSDAKKLLELYRPGEASAAGTDEALALLKSNPELALWHAQQKAFDKTMRKAIDSISIPVALKQALLSEQKIVGPAPWWRHRVSLPAAAAVLLLLVIAAALLAPNPHRFADYRNEIIEESWGRFPHLDIDTSDVQELNRWIAGHDPKVSVSLPPGLSDLNLRGGRFLNWNNRSAALVCLTKGGKHMHLFVTQGNRFPDEPNETKPDFEKCNGWNTVSWRHGDQTFILTGMNYYTFLKKFRRSGQWQIDG
jgi:anti-sigma factor RsiW